jgi:hypothetical protein
MKLQRLPDTRSSYYPDDHGNYLGAMTGKTI